MDTDQLRLILIALGQRITEQDVTYNPDHPFFHDIINCKSPLEISQDNKKAYCPVHKLTVWRCGWSIGFHSGTASKSFLN